MCLQANGYAACAACLRDRQLVRPAWHVVLFVMEAAVRIRRRLLVNEAPDRAVVRGKELATGIGQ